MFFSVAILGGIFTHYDAGLYQQPIAVVTKVHSQKKQVQTDQFQNRDYSQSQKLWLKVLNGRERGRTLTTHNLTSGSNASDLKYRVGQQVFVHIQGTHSIKRVLILDLKRDAVSFQVAWLVIFCLIIVMAKSGTLALLSVLVNAGLFLLAIKIDILTDADQALALYCAVTLFLLAITTLLIYRWSLKTISVFMSSAAAIFLALLLAMGVLAVTHSRGLKFETMSYVTQTRMPLYLAETVLGILGAVMDVSGDITISLFEMQAKGMKLTYQQFYRIGCQVGRSVMGPLTTILFLIFTASMLPLMILYLRNGNNLGYSISMVMSLGIFQSLTSGVGIALAVPISSAFSSWLLKRQVRLK